MLGSRRILTLAALLSCLLPLAVTQPHAQAVSSKRAKPNLILIVADDLGYGDLGCYGQQKILTPHLDRLAAEGIRFTQFYAGSTVCAPSRSVLMTGQHTGHTTVRGNAPANRAAAQSLRAEDVTLAEVLRQAGYRTALIGKWGLGVPDGEGHPNRQGFDYFYGFLSQVHAHNHYPDYLWRNAERIALPNGVVPVGTEGAGYATNRVAYANDLFADEALAYVADHRTAPFFLCLTLTLPHANNERFAPLKDGQEVPDYGPYAGNDWRAPLKGTAAMITRMDGYVGRLIALLKELQLDESTVVAFTSDNGPHQEGGNDPAFFQSSGPYRGIKRALTDGGIRVPLVVRWPGHIAPGQTTPHVAYFGDFMATFAELAGARAPREVDSVSFAPTLLGNASRQPAHECLYWEFFEGGFKQAVLVDQRWKALRLQGPSGPLELYDLKADPAEQHNLAASHPDQLVRAVRLMDKSRRDSPLWPVPGRPANPDLTR